MEAKIAKSALNRLLTRVKPGLAKESSPVGLLTCVLLEAVDDQVVARATSTLTYIRTSGAARVATPGIVAVSHKAIDAAISKLPEGEVSLKLDGAKLIIRAGKARVALPTQAGADFPQMPMPGESAPRVVVKASDFASLLKAVTYAAAPDDTRPQLCGVNLDADPTEGLRASCADGHRLATSTVPTVSGAFPDAVLLPAHAFPALKSLGDKSEGATVTIVAGTHLHLHGDGVDIAIARWDGVFPTVDKLIPNNTTKRVVANREALLARAELCGTVDQYCVSFSFAPGTCDVSASDADNGEASDQIDVDYAGEPIKISFSPEYALDALKSFDSDEIVLEMSTSLGPLKMTAPGETTTGVILPMSGK